MSFLVELRHWMLKDSITLEVGEECLVRDDGLVAALGYDGEIFQVFEQLLVIADGQHDCRAVAVLVREILQGLAHGLKVTLRSSRSRASASGAPTAQPIPAWGNAPGAGCEKNKGLKARAMMHASPNGSGFQPSFFFVPRILGRCPRLVWRRAFGLSRAVCKKSVSTAQRIKFMHGFGSYETAF